MRAAPAGPLTGTVRVPGDKSISHRALILGALATGETRIHGLLRSADVMATAAALGHLGAKIEQTEEGGEPVWAVQGRGLTGLAEPAGVLDMGNSGTACRLLMGAVATHPITALFSGDRSLCRRPMGRVITPLVQMGAQVAARDDGRLPLTIKGTAEPLPIAYRLPVASAQVKSAVLLAGLKTSGRTTVIEPQATRDHTERLLAHFGNPPEIAKVEDEKGGGTAITINGERELAGREVRVPGDPSSAAFAVVAALINPGSEVRLENVGVNPLRGGLFETLTDMGADLVLQNRREDCGEPVADLVVRGGSLDGIEIPAARAPSMIDEYPVLAVAAAFAGGRTVMHGLGELRLKESDRLATIVAGLHAAGVGAEVDGDSLIVEGSGGSGGPAGGGQVASHGDHRIAMAFLVLGTAAKAGMAVSDSHMIASSFPDFGDFMGGLGAGIEDPAL